MTSCFFLTKNVNSLLHASADNIYNNGVLYRKRKEIVPESYSLTKNAVIAYFLSSIEYDTMLDGKIIKAKEYNYMQFDFSLIQKENYQLQYQYNYLGEVSFVQLIGT